MKYILFAFLISSAVFQQDNDDSFGFFVQNDSESQTFYSSEDNEDPTTFTSSQNSTGEVVNDDGSIVEATIDEELNNAGQLISLLERQTSQPEWIRRMGIRNIDIKNRYPNNLIDFEEFTSPVVLTAFDSANDNKEHQITISGVKASEWCFVTFKVHDEPEYLQNERKFFFYCPYLVDSQLENLFLREMLDECTPPLVIEPEPLPVKKCKWFFKKINESYKFSVREMGPVDGADMFECYVESVKQMASQPRVEIMCSSSAIEGDIFQSLTREQYETILENHTNNGDGTFTGELVKDEAVKIQAQ